jgi:hypothetical protein
VAGLLGNPTKDRQTVAAAKLRLAAQARIEDLRGEGG